MSTPHAANHGQRDVRALAARALADVALHGRSLRSALVQAAPQLTDARDRALLTALLHEGARWWLRYVPAVEHLVPRMPRQAEVQALLVLGLVQLEVLQLPAYAAVAATVDAVRKLGHPRMAGMVNAVLRRWLRERDTVIRMLDADPVNRYALPAWLEQAIHTDWPEQADGILQAGNTQAPLTLRVNRRQTTREALAAGLSDAQCPSQPHPWLPDALLLTHSTDVTRLPGFDAGEFSVQDGAAQAAVDLLDARTGTRVLDACAAPGGKACHILERTAVQLTALDNDSERLDRVRANLARLRLHADLHLGDAAQPDAWWDGQPFDRILLDAPCSATGVIRRHPDIRLHRRARDIPTLAAGQSRLLAALWPLLAPGGRLLYVTCSVLRAENEQVVGRFVTAHADARALPIHLPAGHDAGCGWQILPGEDDLDGMFFAALERSDGKSMP